MSGGLGFSHIRGSAIGEDGRMKLLVCVKRVVDYNVKIRVKPDGSGVELANIKTGPHA